MVLVTPLPTKPEDFSQSVDTSSQVSAEMEDASLEEIPAASSPAAKTPGLSSGTHPQMQPISGKRPTRPWEKCY